MPVKQNWPAKELKKNDWLYLTMTETDNETNTSGYIQYTARYTSRGDIASQTNDIFLKADTFLKSSDVDSMSNTTKLSDKALA